MFFLLSPVDHLPPIPSQSMSMQYMVAIIIGCVVFVAIVALVFICCCCRRRNSKLKNKTADMEVSHRGVVAQQVKPFVKKVILIGNPSCDTLNYKRLVCIFSHVTNFHSCFSGSTSPILHCWYG